MPEKLSTCPCCSRLPYQTCCEPCHNADAIPASAEQLMRSRYSAFVLGLVDYLIATTHHSKRLDDDATALRQTIEHTQWLGLKIINTQQAGENEALVEFVAFYQDNGIAQLHEQSRFVFEDGRWFYVDGKFMPAIKLSRNELCFCGSGKKLKRCHGS